MFNPRELALLYFVEHGGKISLLVFSISVVLTGVADRASYGRLKYMVSGYLAECRLTERHLAEYHLVVRVVCPNYVF